MADDPVELFGLARGAMEWEIRDGIENLAIKLQVLSRALGKQRVTHEQLWRRLARLGRSALPSFFNLEAK